MWVPCYLLELCRSCLAHDLILHIGYYHWPSSNFCRPSLIFHCSVGTVVSTLLAFVVKCTFMLRNRREVVITIHLFCCLFCWHCSVHTSLLGRKFSGRGPPVRPSPWAVGREGEGGLRWTEMEEGPHVRPFLTEFFFQSFVVKCTWLMKLLV